MSEQAASAPAAAGPAGPAPGLLRDIGRAALAILRGETARARTQRAALAAFSIRVASAGIAYLTQAMLARWMGSFEYGAFVFVWVWVLILGGVSSLGLNLAAMRFVPEYRERGELGLLRGLLLGGRLAAMAVATLVALAGLCALWLLGDRVAHHYVLPAYLALACLPLYVLGDMQDGIGRAHQWIGAGLVPPYILRPLLLLACMIGAHAAGWPMVATTAAGAAVVATWASALLQLVLLRRRIAATVTPGPRAYDLGTWLKTSLPILMITGFDLVVQNVDVLAISLFMTPSDVGIYYAGLKTICLVSFVHYAVASAVANQFASLHARGDMEALARTVRDAVGWTFWPSLAAVAAILALGKPLLWLFGPAFDAAYGPMFVLAVGLLVKASVGPAEFLLNMAGEQLRCGAVLLATAVLDIVLNLLLVPMYGIWGAAAATSASLAVAGLLYALLAKRRLGLDVGIWSGLRRHGSTKRPA